MVGSNQGKLWTKAEVVTVVYYSSRYICSEALSELLLRRGYERTVSAIRHKIRDIASSNPFLLLHKGKWDADAVDRWMDSSLGHDAVNHLITFTSEDAQIVEQVSTYTSRY